MCIVSKAVFEKDAVVDGKLVGIGDVWPVDRYNSNHKSLETLENGGRIFLVTVRPPNEKLWLVAVIDSPKLKGKAWVSSTKNTTPVADITPLRKTIVFESGKGMSQDKGALGMSLQTPRALAASDTTLLMNVISGASAAPQAPATGPGALLAEIEKDPDNEKTRERVLSELLAMNEIVLVKQGMTGLAHLNAHDETGLPCLCKSCWELSSKTTEMGGITYERDLVVKNKRVLFYWAPVEIASSALRNSVRASLSRRLADLVKSRKKQPRPEF